MRGEPYTPPKLSPEEERELREIVTWHAQKGFTSQSKPWNVQTAINKEKHHLRKSKYYRDVGAQQRKIATAGLGMLINSQCMG